MSSTNATKLTNIPTEFLPVLSNDKFLDLSKLKKKKANAYKMLVKWWNLVCVKG